MEPMTMMALGGAAGGLGSMLGGKAANKPKKSSSTSTLTPYGGAAGTNYLNELLSRGSGLFLGDAPNIGPSDTMQDIFGRMVDFTEQPGGQGLRLGGGRGGPGGGSEGRGRGGRGRGGPGGGGLDEFARMLANYSVEPNEYMRSVLEGDFLREGNPYTQALLDEGFEEYQRSLPSIDARFAQAGRFGSGALAGAHVLANEEFNEAQQQTLGQLWESERNRMMEALGMLSSENSTARGVLGGVKQSQIGANAQVKSSRIAAAAQRAAASMQLRAQMARLGLDERQANFGNLQTLFGNASSLNDLESRNALLPYDLLQQGSSFGQGLLGTFGTTNTQSTGSGAGVNPIAQGLLGGLGGALQGGSLANILGGG